MGLLYPLKVKQSARSLSQIRFPNGPGLAKTLRNRGALPLPTWVVYLVAEPSTHMIVIAGHVSYGLGTVVRIAATVVADDPIFGLIAYGGQLSGSGSLTVLIPRDGIRQRIHILASPYRLHFHLDRDAFKSISYKEDASEINFELEHRTKGAHNTTITLQNLPELSYDVYINNEMTCRFAVNKNENLLVLSLPSEATTKVKILETCEKSIVCDAGTGC